MNATKRTLSLRQVMQSRLGAIALMLMLVVGVGAFFGIRAAMAAGDTTVSFSQAVFTTWTDGAMRKVDVGFTIVNPRADSDLNVVVGMGQSTMQVTIPAGATSAIKTLDMPSVGQLTLNIKSATFACAPTCSFGETQSVPPPTVVVGTPSSATTVDPGAYPGPDNTKYLPFVQN